MSGLDRTNDTNKKSKLSNFLNPDMDLRSNENLIPDLQGTQSNTINVVNYESNENRQIAAEYKLQVIF